MRDRIAASAAAWGGLAVLLLGLAACERTGNRDAVTSGPSTELASIELAAGRKPVVSTVRVSAESAVRFTLTATVTDADGDLVGGTVRVRRLDKNQSVEGEIAQLVIGERVVAAASAGQVESATLDGTALRATIALNTAAKGTLKVAVSVKDRAGNRSTEVRTSVAVPKVALTVDQTTKVRSEMLGLVAEAATRLRLTERKTDALTFSVSTSVACPEGGSVKLSGRVTTANGLDLSASGTASSTGCRIGDGIEVRGSGLPVTASGRCPGSVNVTLRGRATVLINGVVVDPAFPLNESGNFAC